MKNLSLERVEIQTKFLKQNINNLTIDGDTHLTDINSLQENAMEQYRQTQNYYHGRPLGIVEMLVQMEMSDVDMILSWQNPAATFYPGTSTGNYDNLYNANKYIFDMACKYPEKIIPAGWIDPAATGEDVAKSMAEMFVSDFGFPVVKMNPAQNSYPIDSDVVINCTSKIVELGAIPAFHFGADTPYTPMEGLLNVAKAFHNSPILAIHMGGGGAAYIEGEKLYQSARNEGLKQPNLKFVMSAKRDTHMESDFITYQLAGEPFCNNLICASDAPYGRMSWNFGGFRQMFETLQNPMHPDKRLKENRGLFDSNAVQKYLGGNLAKLILEAYERIS